MRSEEILEANAEHEVLEYIVKYEEVQNPALGICKQVLDRGRDSLSDKQEAVFERQVARKYFKMLCSLCHNPMPTNEVVVALAEPDGYCSHCRHMTSKDD